MLDHQLQTNYGLGPLEVLSLLSFQYIHMEGIFLISLEYWLLIAILCISFSELSVEVLVPQLLMGGIFMDMEVAHLQPASRSLKVESY